MPSLLTVRYQEVLEADRIAHALRPTAGSPTDDLQLAAAQCELQTRVEALWLQQAADPAANVVPLHRDRCYISLADRYIHPKAPCAPSPLSAADVAAMAVTDGTAFARPQGCAFVERSELLICFPYANLVVDANTGAVLQALANQGTQLVSVVRNVAVLQLGNAVALYDLARGGSWLDTAVDDVPLDHTFEVQEQAFLVRPRQGVEAAVCDLTDYPRPVVHSPDLRHVWVDDNMGEGGVYAFESGLRQTSFGRRYETSPQCPVLDISWPVPAPTVPEADNKAYDLAAESAVRAFTLTPQARWLVFSALTLWYAETPLFRVSAPVRAAAFTSSGDRLLLCTDAAVCVVDIAAPARPVVCSLVSLASWAAQLDFAAVAPDLTGAARMRLALRFGTAHGLAAADPAAIAEAAGVTPVDSLTLRERARHLGPWPR